MALDVKPAKYKGFTIRYSRGDWYVDDASNRVVASVWSKKDGKRWVDARLKELETSRESNPAIIGTKAKRGDLIVYPVQSSVIYANYRGSERSTGYQLALVTGVTREGAVGKYRAVNTSGLDSYDHKGRPTSVWIIGQDTLRVNARKVIDDYIARHEWDRDFKSLDEAKGFLRKYLK